MLDEYEQKLLEGWEDVYKKGQLKLWILLALKDGAKYMPAIKEFIATSTNGILEADDKSMYRALRQYDHAEIVTFQLDPNDQGPDRKSYMLTETGFKVLEAFIQRNITDIYFAEATKKLLER
jgi:DNA-binding PadR family transcriptional regulator